MIGLPIHLDAYEWSNKLYVHVHEHIKLCVHVNRGIELCAVLCTVMSFSFIVCVCLSEITTLVFGLGRVCF